MINKLPKEIIGYMIDNIPPFTGIAIVKTDNSGTVKGYYGSFDKYLNKVPSEGIQIADLFPFVEGLIPLPQESILLPNMQVGDKTYADIHIVLTKDNNHWLFFMDRTQDVESIRDIIQGINEKKLESEKKDKSYSFDNPFGDTAIFGTQVFLKIDNETAVPLGESPLWVTGAKELSGIIIKNKAVKIKDIFPFLEVFFEEAADHWESGKETLFNSGIWIENFKKDEDTLLKAGATTRNGKQFLLIRKINGDVGEEQEVIQKAREQKLLYEKLDKTKSRLKQLLDYKERFVSIISHDLRSPVASVLGIAEMLTNDEDFLDKLDDFNREMIMSIKEEMQRLLDYNDKLYHWSNLELGNFEIVHEKINLFELVTKAYQTSKAKMDAKSIVFENSVDKDTAIEVDITLILQVLNNLLSNAVKFTPNNGNISVSSQFTGDGINLVVADSGVGMPPEVRDTLFDDSIRSTTLGTLGEKGSGLGIGIIKKIIDAHGFSIKVESEKGKGTSFIISIPKENIS